MIFNIIKANARIKELETENANLLKAGAAKESEYEGYKVQVQAAYEDHVKQVEESKAAKEAHSKEIEFLKAEHAKAVEALEITHMKELDAVSKSTGFKAAQTVAGLGIAPETVKETISNESPEQILATFNKLSGQAQSEFYKTHKATILKANGL